MRFVYFLDQAPVDFEMLYNFGAGQKNEIQLLPIKKRYAQSSVIFIAKSLDVYILEFLMLSNKLEFFAANKKSLNSFEYLRNSQFEFS